MTTNRGKIFCLAALAAALCLCAQIAQAALPDFTTLAEKAGPAVVNISAEGSGKNQRQAQLPPGMPKSPGGQGQPGNPGQGTPFDDFFRQFDEFFGKGMPMPRKERSLGSGFVISADGFILTNNHVVESASKIMVKLQNASKPVPAKIIGTDPDTDLALIKIDGEKNLPYLKLADSNKAKVGEWVLAIGNPFGLDHTVTKGIISAKGRVIGAGPYDDFIQTDASINPGNSGGPLIDMNGEVVGINTAIVAAGQGIGFAIPSDLAKEVVATLKDGKKMRRGLLGVSVQDVDENAAKALGLSKTKGALVVQVIAGGPAEKAGVQNGDVITEVDGQNVSDSRDLTRRIGHMAPKDSVKVTVMRQGQTKTLTAVLDERDSKAIAQAEGRGTDAAPEGVLGMMLKPVNPKEAKAFGTPVGKGLLITNIDNDSPAVDAGLRRGDVILEMNQTPVASVEDARKIVDRDGKSKGAVMMLIVRGGQQMIRTVAVN